MMETAQDLREDDGSAALASIGLHSRQIWNRLVDSLMGTGVIEVLHILLENTREMTFVEDKDVMQTLPADNCQGALADGIGPRGTDRDPEDLDPADRGDTNDLCAVRAVIITNQIAWSNPKGRRLTQLLSNPPVLWMPRHPHVHRGP